jgi:hypothetical protein
MPFLIEEYLSRIGGSDNNEISHTISDSNNDGRNISSKYLAVPASSCTASQQPQAANIVTSTMDESPISSAMSGMSKLGIDTEANIISMMHNHNHGNIEVTWTDHDETNLSPATAQSAMDPL